MLTALAGKQSTLTTSSALSVASVTTSGSSTMSGGLRISGGQGNNGTGANLRVTGTGDAVYNTSALLFGNSSVDLHQFELSWLGFGQLYRTSSSTAWAQTMNISLSTGAWSFYKGYGNASDRSLKGSPQDASTEDALNVRRQVSAKTYTRLDLPDDDGLRLGFIAQDVEAAAPPSWSNLVMKTNYKWSGAPEGAEIKILDYARLTSVLWQCTRSLLARVESLEARVAQLAP